MYTKNEPPTPSPCSEPPTPSPMRSFLTCIILLVVVVAGLLGLERVVLIKQQQMKYRTIWDTVTTAQGGQTGSGIRRNEEPEYTASLEEKEDWVYQELTRLGYSPAAACGIMGNILAESEFKSDYYAPNGAFGLFQWTNDGYRKSSYFQWCKDNEIDDISMTGQLVYAIRELEGGDDISSRLQEYLISVEDPAAAAMEFAVGFERCVDFSRYPHGTVYQGVLYPEFYGYHYQAIDKRIDAAKDYYQRYVK